MKSLDIAIIGAGPIGCHAATLLAQQGHKVTVYEEHKKVGEPIQCTGLLTKDFDKFFPNINKQEFLINTFTEVKVISKNQTLTTKQKEYLVCRTKFDQSFKNRAIQAGATIKEQHSFIRKEGRGLIIKDKQNNKEFKITPHLVIAADGPLSKTAKAYNLYEKSRKNYYGIQAVVTKQTQKDSNDSKETIKTNAPNETKHPQSQDTFNNHQFITYFNNNLCPDFFIWDVPENKNQSRVGLASKQPPKKFFDKIIKQNNYKIEHMQAGVIPIYSHKQKMQKDNCYLLGDAAGHVKATTLGGLIPGLRAAKILATKINTNTHKNGGYHRALKPLRRELLLHRLIRDLMDKFTNKDWDRLITLTKQNKIKKVFEKYSRDNPIPLTFLSLLKEPRYLYLIRHFPKLLF